jgi:hypothetical protein
MAQATQTRCRGCGEFIAERPGLDDWAAEERAYHVDRYQEHHCEAEYTGYSLAPRAGEYDAYLASLDGDELVAELGPDGAAAYLGAWAGEVADIAPSLAQAKRNVEVVAVEQTTEKGEQHGQPVSTVRMRAKATRPADAQMPAMRMGARLVRPAAYLTHHAEQVNLLGAAQPGRPGPSGRVRPAPYLDAPPGWWHPDRPARGHATRGQGAGVERDRAGVSAGAGRLSGEAGLARIGDDPPARAEASPHRRGVGRLSRVLRWFQADDPRLARPLEPVARAVEWVERAYR